MIIATTNHPETFLGNLTNRQEDFPDKIEVSWPDSNARKALLKSSDKEKKLLRIII